MFIDNAMCPSSHLVLFLDVITDCMTNFNDLTETNILLDKLNDMTENKEITVIGVIHENPDGTKKARGHIGTEFVNKATTVVSIGYKNEYSPILSLRIIKNRLVKRQKEKFIKRSEKTGLLVFADSSEIEDIQSNKRIKLSELSEMLLQKFGVGEISNKELLKFTMHQFSVSDKTSRIAINDLYENQSFLKDKGFELKRKKGMHNSNIYKLVKLEEMLDFIEPQEV